MAATIRLEWQRDSNGYDIDERPKKEGRTYLTSDPGGTFVVPQGGKKETYVVEGIRDRVFEKLANTQNTTGGVLSFANAWGLLGNAMSEGDMREQEVSDFYEGIKDLRWLINLAQELRATQQLSRLEQAMNQKGVGPMNLRFGRLLGDSTPRLFFQPRSLWLFCCTEVMQIVAAGGEIKNCLNCGAFFTIGIDPGARSTRTYCSNRCRMAMHRRKNG
jgi:hypothetical protein